MSEKKLYCWRVMQESPKIEAWGEATEQDVISWIASHECKEIARLKVISDKLGDATENVFMKRAGWVKAEDVIKFFQDHYSKGSAKSLVSRFRNVFGSGKQEHNTQPVISVGEAHTEGLNSPAQKTDRIRPKNKNGLGGWG